MTKESVAHVLYVWVCVSTTDVILLFYTLINDHYQFVITLLLSTFARRAHNSRAAASCYTFLHYNNIMIIRPWSITRSWSGRVRSLSTAWNPPVRPPRYPCERARRVCRNTRARVEAAAAASRSPGRRKEGLWRCALAAPCLRHTDTLIAFTRARSSTTRRDRHDDDDDNRSRAN